MSLTRASRTFVLALRRPGSKSLPSDLICDAVSKACLRSRAKKIPKSVGARTYPWLTPLRMSKGLEELHCPFHVCMEGYNHALQFGWPAYLWKNLEETASADKIKRLCEVNESNIQGHMLFSALLLELAKAVSIVDHPARKPYYYSGNIRSASFYSRINVTFAKTLPVMLRREMPM